MWCIHDDAEQDKQMFVISFNKRDVDFLSPYTAQPGAAKHINKQMKKGFCLHTQRSVSTRRPECAQFRVDLKINPDPVDLNVFS